MIAAILIVWVVFTIFGATCYRMGRRDGRAGR